MILIFFLIYTAPSIVVYNYAYFLMQPKYLCTYPDLTVKTCSVEEMCEMQNQVSSREEYIKEVDWSASESLSNWIYRLNLECSETYKIGLFGTFEFCGQFFACFIFPPLSDIYGRRLFTYIGLIMQTVVFIGLFMFQHYQYFYTLIFVLGNSVIIRYLIVYAHLMEFVASK